MLWGPHGVDELGNILIVASNIGLISWQGSLPRSTLLVDTSTLLPALLLERSQTERGYFV